ncbi:restriction endonuclease [Bacillus cereus]|uniref:NgoBV family restriction endonuclease n=1 Tax=Bacillus cereus TaxID=1396 RepID=UPI000BF74EC5|nr:NgoBV family restriction endonuclease [Bacillus cereus]PER14577.1 restriction endonuclease [Bacillus cereus]PEW53042.1 restriction endonuclease [Bacillus cereus]PEX41745.1 restriction endonuclease [Bacillus cereus]PEZ94802.1 restriction endonuclease [Bacillus cereus]PFF03713.1 restriction endonuclease [Bacillus cereus]
MPKILNAEQLYHELLTSDVLSLSGYITFHLGNTRVQINTTDTVGVTLQAWLKQWLIDNDIYFYEPTNTQEFPDFFLNNIDPHCHMLEVKAFNYSNSPAFDIANFDSYCTSLVSQPHRLNADYLIFGYEMDSEGIITLNKIWLKKIWEIAGISAKYPLKTQIKKKIIYNIRPNSQFKKGKKTPFSNKYEFITALYGTMMSYYDKETADQWLNSLKAKLDKE